MFDVLNLEINKETYNKWQNIIDNVSSKLKIPVGLIMKASPTRTNVFIATKAQNNPYTVGDSSKMEDTYCNTVLRSNKSLHVKNTLKSDKDTPNGL